MIKNKIRNKIISLIIMTVILFIMTMISKYQLSIVNKRFSLYLLIFAVIISTIYVISRYKDFGLKDKTINIFFSFLDYFNTAVFAVIFIHVFSLFLIFPKVRGTSMQNTLFEGERIVVQRHSKIERFDVVVFYVDEDRLENIPLSENGSLWVKRVIGLPGDRITYIDGGLYINDKYYEEPYLDLFGYETILPTELNNIIIPDGYYLLLGDNRPSSNDSRIIGLVNEDLLIGEVKYVQKGILLWEKVR